MSAPPKHTRLRYVASKERDIVVSFFEALGRRVLIYGSPQWDGERWTVWFVPDDRGADVTGGVLD